MYLRNSHGCIGSDSTIASQCKKEAFYILMDRRNDLICFHPPLEHHGISPDAWSSDLSGNMSFHSMDRRMIFTK